MLTLPFNRSIERGGWMSRLSKLGPCAVALMLALGSFSCGSHSSSTPSFTIQVTMSPSPTASMNVGSTLQFSATVTRNKSVISTPITFISKNRRILQFAPSGLACAGNWDSSFIVCSPGASGVVQVIASGFGTPSAPTTVYVHPPVTSIVSSPVNAPAAGCVPQKQTETFQATVFSGSNDITPFVGPLTWSVVDGSVAIPSTTAAGLQPNQVEVTAAQPGQTHVFASSSGINGDAHNSPFTTCPVQSISIAAPGGANSLSLATGSSAKLGVSVLDSQGNAITANGLTWISSQPAIVAGKSATISALSPGGAAIFPVCAPPTCNVNLQEIYSSNVVNATVTGSSAKGTVYVTSTGCVGVSGCNVSLVPIDTQTNSPGTTVALPSPPNSMVMDPTGANIYFGTAAGLRIFAIAPITFSSAATGAGKALAASPDGTHEIVSDTSSSPNVVYIINSKAGSVTPLLLNGVTAAAFSPDSRSAYLMAGSTLYIYPTSGALQTITLPGPATDAAFLTTGAFGFVAGSPSTVSLFNGCNFAAPQSPNTSSVSTTAPPLLLASLPDGKTIAAVTASGFDILSVNTSAAGCPPPVTVSSPTFQDFGQGAFTPQQVLVSSDGARLFVISNLNAVMVYDFTSNSVHTIALSSGATPLSGALTLSGQDLYVGASDGTVHRLDAANTFTDLGRIPVTLCSNKSVSCPPNLVALRP